MHKYGRLIRYAWRERRALILILVMTALYAAVAALQPWPLKLLVDMALGGKPAAALPGPAGAFFPVELPPLGWTVAAAALGLAIFAANGLLDSGLTWAWSSAGQRMVYNLAADLFRRLQRLSLLFHSRRSVGDSLSRLTGDAWCVYTAAEGLIAAPLQHLTQLVVIGLVAWSLDPGLALISLAVAPALGGSALFFGRRLKRRARASREAQARLMSFVHQTLGAVPMVQAFDAVGRNRRRFERLADSAVVAGQRQTAIRSAYGMMNGLALTLGACVVLLAGGRRVLDGSLSLGSLLVFLGYVRSLQGACQGLMGIHGTMQSVGASIDRVMEILETGEEVPEAPGARPFPGRVRGLVTVENVTFGYESGMPVLSGVSLCAEPGRTVALVGRTGAGKSTLVSLIPRLYDPWQGRVCFDGVDIRGVGLQSVRSSVSIVMQEPFLLPLTIGKNIAYGRPVASKEEIEAAARQANAHEFIERLPDGYDTVLGERGSTLSGGQRQRLAIARAFLKDAPVLILDEPSASLDPASEALLVDALKRLREGRTTFIIAHRLSTIMHADRVVVMEAGRAVESGTHGELIALGGVYSRLCSRQFADPPGEAQA